MITKLLHQHTTLVTTVSLAIVVFGLVFHVLFYVVLPSYTPTIPANRIIMPPVSTTSDVAINPAEIMQQSAYIRWAIIGTVVVSVALLGLMGVSVVGHLRSQKAQRDAQRKHDLDRLKKAFFDFRAVHGHFPLSSTYRPEFYTGINLSKDWNYYGLPNPEQMRQVLADWPISDPSIDYNGSNQFNQYLYYPREEGQAFDIYAHLEVIEGQPTDYNQIDNLLRSWGEYNYKVSSHGQTSEATPPPPTLNPQALSEEEKLAQQAIVEQTIPLDTTEVNAELQFLADEVVANPKPSLPEPIAAPSQPTVTTPSDQIGQLHQAVAAKQSIRTDGLPEASEAETMPVGPITVGPQPLEVAQIGQVQHAVNPDTSVDPPSTQPDAQSDSPIGDILGPTDQGDNGDS